MRANLRKIKTRAIWVRKDDLLPQMKSNIVITALKVEHTSSGWYLDFGCSKHMTGDETKLLNKTRFAGGKVVFGDGVSSQIIGKGTLKEEGMAVLENVLLVKGLKANLLSISQFCDSDHTVTFSKKNCKILNDKGKCIITGFRTPDNCYTVKTGSETCNIVRMDDNEIWHNCMGHLSYDILGRLSSQEIVRGIPKIKPISSVVCGHCQEGKIVKTSHKKVKDILTSRPLDLIHMDLIGPSRTVSL